MRTFWMIPVATATVLLLALPSATTIRHDGACRPAGSFFTDAPDSWAGADALASLNCLGEMHPIAGGPFPDDHDWFYVNVVPTDTKRISVTLCPAFTFVAPWNPNLNLFFLPAAGLLPALPPIVGQQLQGAQPVTSKIPGAIPIGSSANAAGCDAVVGASLLPGGAASGGGRYYIDVARGSGGGGYTLTTALVV